MKQVAKLTLVKNLNDRAEHPFAGEPRDITLLIPPTLGLPLVFGEGHTSMVLAGAFTPPANREAPAVWTFQTANSEYRLEVREVADEADIPFAGGPIGHA